MSCQDSNQRSIDLKIAPNSDEASRRIPPTDKPSTPSPAIDEGTNNVKVNGCIVSPERSNHTATSPGRRPKRIRGKPETTMSNSQTQQRLAKASRAIDCRKTLKEKTKQLDDYSPSPPCKNKKSSLSPASRKRPKPLVTAVPSSSVKGKAVRRLKFTASPEHKASDIDLPSMKSSHPMTVWPGLSPSEQTENKTPETGNLPDQGLSQMEVSSDQAFLESETVVERTEASSSGTLMKDAESVESPTESPGSSNFSVLSPSKTLPLRRFRRSLSEVYPCSYPLLGRGRRASELPPTTTAFNSPGDDNRKGGINSVDSLRSLNQDLRDQVARLRTQLEAQMGHIKQAQWQKVVFIRQVRQQEQQQCAVALSEQRTRLEKEKAREVDLLREQLVQKSETDIQRLTRFKDAEINKLKLELDSKDAMLQRLLGENRHVRVRLNIDDRKSKLLDELKELRQAKKELEESLNHASSAERTFSNDLRKHSASFESELTKIKREAQIENSQLIEQLKNKDKIISQLEKDLGHRWGAAQFAALERRRSEGCPLPPGGNSPSHPLRALPDGSESPETLLWTPTSASETEGVEDVWSKMLEGNSISKQDLLFKLKDSKDRTKELLDKCRSYLQQNKELTAQNRAFKESSERANQEFKTAQELLEHSKLQVLHLSRQLSHVKMEKGNLEQQARGLDRLREEITEDKKMISALRKACSDKDRRIELIQHRKKRRRVLGSAEKHMFQSAGLRETYYGYEEEPKTAESDQSLSSSIASTISDEDMRDDEWSPEEMERNYQRLVLEHMELQKLHSLLQRQTGNMVDPQREHMDKTALQNDLFSAQCRIEHLEKLVGEIGEGEMRQLLVEREAIIEANRQLEGKARSLENNYRQLQKELTKAEERSEELEFRLMELEQCEDRDQNASGEVSTSSHVQEDGIDAEPGDGDPLWQEVHQEMDQLRQELKVLLKGKGKEAEAVLKKLDQMKETERKMEGLEVMARELQVKVISLQKENSSLQDKLLLMEESTSGKGNHSASLSAAQERKENLELKATVEHHGDVDFKLSGERELLLQELEQWRAQCHALKRHLNAMVRSQQKHYIQKQRQETALQTDPESSPIQKVEMPLLSSSARGRHSDHGMPPVHTYNKKSSHRKSKSRSGDEPTISKRRKSSTDQSISSHKSRKLKNRKSEGDVMMESEYNLVRKSSKLNHDFPASTKSDEKQEMKNNLLFLEDEVVTLKKENTELRRQVKRGAEGKSDNGNGDQILKDNLTALERELDLLHKENVALGEQLRQRAEEFQFQRDDLNPRVSELEEYCEDLQERLHGSETVERQLREKLKFVEGSIEDAENSELAMREQCRQLLTGDLEAKKQIQALQKTGQELKDIVLEKEFVEQALRDKVDFLQKAEAASVVRIEELEQIEKELREQLEQKSDGKTQSQRDAHKIQELKHQMTFLQKDNQALSARVAELEENEETLRENWRRVADEDFNRTQCLEEKVKMLESLNRELKSKLTDAQEYFVINTVNQLDTSLAAELAESQSGRDVSRKDEVDGDMPASSAENSKEGETEKKVLKEKMRKLERKLSDMSEEKNTKIETLQEQLVGLRETEIKLSETISEMEMTERELRAKLALYESSEVTVEKMLKYQSKIEELRTSQESLLDQLESMENQEMSLQEKLQEMERTLRGKIVTLEVEMKRFKQKELKNAGHIRDLEKQESALTSKVAQQAEKENNLYMKINSLMEELKSTKENLEKAEQQLEEKEEKVRHVKLLEVKLLEIEMDYGKKTNELNTKLRHQEEEFRQKDSANEQEISNLREEVAKRDAQEKEQREHWEHNLAQMNSEAESTVSVLNSDLNKINIERDDLKDKVTDLSQTVQELRDARTSLEEEISSLKKEVTYLTSMVNEKEDCISTLSYQVEDEKKKAQKVAKKLNELEIELSNEKEKVSETEEKLQNLKSEIDSKLVNMTTIVTEKEGEHQRQLKSLESEIGLKESKLKELEEELKHKKEIVGQLQEERDQLKIEASQAKTIFADGAFKLKTFTEKVLSTLDEATHQKLYAMNEKLKYMQENVVALGGHITDGQSKGIEFENEKASMVREWEDKLFALREEQSSKESELKNRVMFLDNQLQQEVMEKEVQQSSYQKMSQDKEVAIKSEIDSLQQEVETHKLELIGKLSELETKNKEHCELSLKFSELRHSYKTLQMDYDHSKESFLDKENKFKHLLSQKDEKLSQRDKTIEDLSEEVSLLKVSLTDKEKMVQTLSEDKDLIVKEKAEEVQRVSMEKSHKVQLEVQLDTRCKELEEIQQQYNNLQLEMDNLKVKAEENNNLLKQNKQEKDECNVQLQEANKHCNEIYQELSHATKNLKEKDAVINEQKELLSANVSQIEEVKKELAQKEKELDKLTSESELLESRHLSQLSEHHQNLEKYQESIQELQNSLEVKDQIIKERDQTYKEIQVELEDLSLHLKERDEKLQQAETQVADVTFQLKQVENKYRELESKCASLEMTLEERYTVTQDAQKVLAKKEIQCKEIEEQLVKAEKDLEKLQAQVSVENEDSKYFANQLKSKEEELEYLHTKTSELKRELEKNSQEYANLEAKFVDMKQDHVFLENQLEQEKEKANTTENCLLETEKECQNLQDKVLDCQNHISQKEDENSKLKEQLTLLQSTYDEREAKIQILNRSLQEYEIACQEKNSRINSLESELGEGERINFEEREQMKNLLETVSQKVENLSSDLTQSKKREEEKDQSLTKSLKEIESLEQNYADSKLMCEKLKSQVKDAQSLCDDKARKLLQVEETLTSTQFELEDHKLKLEQVVLERKDNQEKWQESQEAHSDSMSKLYQLGNVVEEKDAEVMTLKKKVFELDQTLSQIAGERDSLLSSNEKLNSEVLNRENSLKTLTVDIDALSSRVKSEQENNVALQGTVKELQEDLSMANTKCSELMNTNENLSSKLFDKEAQYNDLHLKSKDLELNLSQCCQERDDLSTQSASFKTEKVMLEDDNQQLQKELDNASKEFDNLRLSCEQSKANIERKMNEMSKQKQDLEKGLEEQTILLNEMNQKMAAKENAMQDALGQMQTDNENLQKELSETNKENLLLLSEIQALKDKMSSTNQMSKFYSACNQNEENIISEDCIKVSFAPTMQSQIASQTPPNTDVKKENENVDENVEKLSTEITSFQLRDESHEQKVIKLEKVLEEMTGREGKMRKRVDELESIEKDLREQIVDIEMTVIVPLETENQELKDEISMMQQERDEAIAKISTWDDEESGVDAVESAHHRLEEALVQVEELEKKNDILHTDITKLESEKEKLVKALAELEAGVLDKDEKLESLSEEVDRLLQVEKKVPVLEESETRLMDRVLDLEECEQSLTQKLQFLSSKREGEDNSGHQSKLAELEKKLHYLEEKNQILQDAEGQYMDKVMELEEQVERLKSELSSHKPISLSNVSLSEKVSITNVNSVSNVPLQSNITSGANNVHDFYVDSLGTNTSQSPLPQEIEVESSTELSSLQNQLRESKKADKDIVSESEKKDAEISYLGEKLELLRDSEARLMEKLLEAEENSSRLKSDISRATSDLKAKIEHLQEENEFLAGNIENYQKLYKEEKERSVDLQERLMEDSSRLAELVRTQQELANTQQMVQDIQSEYEEQLSERLHDETNLRDEFSSLTTKYHAVEQELAARCQREVELGLRIDTLEQSERELKARLESLMKGEEDESLLSDSGLSGDDPRSRHDAAHYQEKHLSIENPVTKTSTASILLSATHHHQNKTTQSEPFKNQSVSSENLNPQSAEEVTVQKDLIFLVENLQQREEALKYKVQELTVLVNAHSPAHLKELEDRNFELESRLQDAEVEKSKLVADASLRLKSTTSLDLASIQEESLPYSSAAFGNSDDNNNENYRRFGREEEEEVADKELDRSFSSVLSVSSSTMLEKPEDVLIQRIRELEGLDKHNKNQLSELEKDREVLHEIARKDKAAIHDLNVRIRELQLSERSLKEQVANLEVSENSLFSKCEELEAIKAQLEDRVHELEIHERRLRELVRKLKLDEERWLSKSGGFETAVAELSANEQQLKRLLQDVEMEKGGLTERADYLELRIRELESVETSLLSRIENYEANEVGLQNRLVLLENSETASRSKSSELEILNKDLVKRMKKVSDENSMMSQHLSQLHGQIQELDRRLLSSRDSELAFKQHVESLQKNESSLQKKVREYELREIDSQSQVRELEQHLEINKDKIAALQRSENRLKYRVQELEGLGAPIPGELTPSQRQKIPQKLEDCQKRIVVLQSQVENLQLQLRQALITTSQSQPALQSDDNNNVTIATEEYSQLHAKVAMLNEITYQNEELEAVNEHLNDTILELRQGKGACGHEVEIEVLKRRINSLKTFIEKLKSSLSEGQATSLSDPDQDSGPQGETLPARNLQVLESERVLQSVRGLNHDGKADTTSNGDVRLGDQVPVEETMMQTNVTQKMAAPSRGSPYDPYSTGVNNEVTSKNLEEPHWKTIEARRAPVANDSRGGVKVTSKMPSSHKQQSSSQEVEEVTLGLNLQSESELSSHYKASQNDTDSSCSPIAPPRRSRGRRASKNNEQKTSSGNESTTEPAFTKTAATAVLAANQKHFDNDKSLPSMAHATTSSPRKGYESPAPLSRFGEDSFYLPSSTQEGVDSLDDDEAPPLPLCGPPGMEGLEPVVSRHSSEASVSMSQERRDSADSMDNSTSGLSIRDRIAMIEKNLRSDTQASSIGSRDEEDQTLFWKRKSSEFSRQVDSLDKENKFVKEDINRLEKELEEKRRYIHSLEVWLSSTEDLLRNKNKQTDREMVEQLQLELAKLRKELKQAGYRSEDALLDPAALKTELEHRDREIVSKRNEIEALTHEVKRWHKECRSIEGMRRTALDSLRQLEQEVLALQDTEKTHEGTQAELRKLKARYENKQVDLQNVIIEKEDVEFAMKSVILERDGLKVELRKAEQERDELKPQMETVSRQLEELSDVATKNSTLQDQLNDLNKIMLQRTDKTREVYEENLNLRDRVNESEGELSRYRTLCDDFNNLSARYDEMEQFKNQALAMVQPLQLEVEKLTKKCKEKDALLRRLGNELRRGLHRPSSALEELTRLERAMASEEYSMDNSEEIRNGTFSPRPGHNVRSRSVSMDELNFSHSDSDSVHSISSPIGTPTRRQRPTPYVNNRPRSAETVGVALRGQRGVHTRSRWNTRGQRPSVPPPKVYKGQFVAIADYDPGLFSQSGRPRLELLLREGDQVTVTGPMDRHGYCEAEVSGRTGLVPAIYLQPSSQQPPAINGHTSQSSVIHLHHSPRPQEDYTINGPSGREEDLSRLGPSLEGHDTPDPPHHLHIKSVTGNSLVLAWLPPKLDLRGSNKGFTLMGFKIYVNNQEYAEVEDPHCCEVVIKDLNIMYPVLLAVQSTYADGQVSPRTELVFEGMVTMMDAETQQGGQGDLDTDLSSVLNSVQYKRGHRKTVIALYDYNPEQQSPHDYTAFELAFQAGDVVSVYGDPRPDGFFHGEIEGKRGLIPACFVEDVPSSRRNFKDGSEDTIHASSKA